MKTTKKSFSGNPFVNIFQLMVANLQKKEIVKKATLVSFVLLCVLIRFSILSADKNLVKQNKQVSFSTKNHNQLVWPARLMLKSETNNKQFFIQFKTQPKSFDQSRNSLNSYFEN